MEQALEWCAVVPAGGSGRRLGGLDKPAVEVGGRTLLAHLLAGLPDGVPVAVVGPERAGAVAERAEPGGVVLGCREEPPGGGPAAAVAAGVAALARQGLLADVVVVLPGDAPWSAHAVPLLLEALRAAPSQAAVDDAQAAVDDARAAVAVDAAGRRQVLVVAHRTGPLRARLTALGQRDPGLAGVAAAQLLPPPPWLREVRVSDALLADVDTPDDLAALRRAAAGGG